MRVIGGTARSLRLHCPGGLQIRPTADIIRESLFDSLGPRIVGAAFCDLYAGCGAVGIEAASRGARPVVFIERKPGAVRAIEANLAHTRLADRAVVLQGDVLARYAQAAAEWGPFEVVFADPPYGLGELGELARRLIAEAEGVTPGGLVVIQHSGRQELVGLPQPERVKQFGESVLSFFEVAAEGG
ncbi:MAG: RsmD family RNA methyltransferase [Armatimonadota bacterium]